MGIKVSEMTTATSINENDWLMLVQGGENKKIDASLFQLKSQPCANALKLEGYGASDFLGANGTAANAAKLGGLDASDYATKAYVDARTGGDSGADPDYWTWQWCMPELWHRTDLLPDQEDPTDPSDWAFCDGRSLAKDEYPDLYAVIGMDFSWYQYNNEWVKISDSDPNFLIPNLSGRFILGAETGVLRTTHNLPTGIYTGADFTDGGQYKFPSQAGLTGGCAVTTQDSQEQLVTHSHLFDERSLSPNKAKSSGSIQGVQPEDAGDARSWRFTQGVTDANRNVVGNQTSRAIYPNVMGQNKGMLSMPPYFTFAYIMRIKKPSSVTNL